MAVNDLTAVGVIKGLLNSGCRVPQDISVTGFDKTRLAEYSNPSITTVDIHRETLGHMAADALHELSSSDRPSGPRISDRRGTRVRRFLRASFRLNRQLQIDRLADAVIQRNACGMPDRNDERSIYVTSRFL